MKRQYLLNLKKYQGQYIQAELKKADNKHIDELYENEKLTELAIYKGINNYRVNWYDNLEEVKTELKQYIKDNNIKEFYKGNIQNAGYFGNYCMPYIIEKDALKLKQYFGDKIKLDLYRHYIGQEEIKNFKIGDKVILNKTTSFGINTDNKGSIYKIDDNSITIKKYRSKTKGWVIFTGDEAIIKKLIK